MTLPGSSGFAPIIKLARQTVARATRPRTTVDLGRRVPAITLPTVRDSFIAEGVDSGTGQEYEITMGCLT